MSAVFVTTGATIVFEELIRSTLDERFINKLKSLGYIKLVVQYGVSGAELFGQCLSKLSLDNDSFSVEGFPFSDDISSIISQCDVVVSHAGTGSILDTLRLKKKLIVMVNDKLMDNHQLEIAQELENNGCLLKTCASLQGLLSCFHKLQSFNQHPLPEPDPNIIEDILHEL